MLRGKNKSFKSSFLIIRSQSSSLLRKYFSKVLTSEVSISENIYLQKETVQKLFLLKVF